MGGSGAEPSPITELLDAFRRRSKALRHHFAVIECEQVIVREADGEIRKLELRFADRSRSGQSIRLHVWEDRWAWLDIRHGAPEGWSWAWTTDGRLSGGTSYRDLLDAIERSKQLIPHGGDAPNIDTLAAFWRPILLQGPKATP